MEPKLLAKGVRYQRHRPEQTLLYQIVERYYPELTQFMARQGKRLPNYIQQEFDDFLKCGRLEYGFLRLRCDSCKQEHLLAFSCKRRGFCPSFGARRMAERAALLVDEVLPQRPMRQWVLSMPYQLRFLFASQPKIMSQALGIVYRAIATYITKQAGCTKASSQMGAVTLIQRFGGAVNLNVHFHILFLDGVFVGNTFKQIYAPTNESIIKLTHTIATCIGMYLERQGLLERDAENSYLTPPATQDEEDPLPHLYGSSITYRIAYGSQQGPKVFTLQTLPPDTLDEPRQTVSGFSLHAGVATKAHDREKLERICRYIARPAIAEHRLLLTQNAMVRYQLKTPYRDGTTHVLFEPLDFTSKLAALVPKPRVNLTRYHGVFAPNSKHRVQVTPAKRGKGAEAREDTNAQARTHAEQHTTMTCTRYSWA